MPGTVCVPPAYGANVSLLYWISLGNRMADNLVGKVSDYITAGCTVQMNERINLLYGAGVNIHLTKCPGERVLSFLSGEGRSSCSALLNTTPVSVTTQVGKWSRDLVGKSNKAGQCALHSAVNANTSSALWLSVSLHKHGNNKRKSASFPYQILSYYVQSLWQTCHVHLRHYANQAIIRIAKPENGHCSKKFRKSQKRWYKNLCKAINVYAIWQTDRAST